MPLFRNIGLHCIAFTTSQDVCYRNVYVMSYILLAKRSGSLPDPVPHDHHIHPISDLFFYLLTTNVIYIVCLKWPLVIYILETVNLKNVYPQRNKPWKYELLRPQQGHWVDSHVLGHCVTTAVFTVRCLCYWCARMVKLMSCVNMIV